MSMSEDCTNVGDACGLDLGKNNSSTPKQIPIKVKRYIEIFFIDFLVNALVTFAGLIVY